MAEELYNQEQLEGMNRLYIRRIVKKMGMSSDDAGDMKAAPLIEWILENQGEKSGKKAGGKKANGRKATGGRKAPPKRRRESEPESEPEPEEKNTEEVEGDWAPILNKVIDVEAKVDELGTVYNENYGSLVQQVGDLNVEIYCMKGMLMKLFETLHAEEIIPTDGTEELEGLEKECEGGNE